MRDEFKNSENWYYRFLPHYDASDKYQFITYRLFDSLPKSVLIDLKEKCFKSKIIDEADKQKYKILIDKFLDKGHGSCLLGNESAAKIVQENWYFFHKVRYDLIAFVIMPNHVHLLIKTYKNWPLNKVIHSWKSFSAHKIKKTLKLSNEFCVWQREYWDTFIRDEKHFRKALNYIHTNPVKAGLVKSEVLWPFSSYKP